MYFQSIVVSLLLATSVAAKGNKTDSTRTLSEASQCKEITSLNKLVELASNTTKLDKVTKNNATEIADIQAKASSASAKLSTLQSNTTLMSACAVIDAQAAEDDKCQETFILQRFVKFAANTTAVATATKNNSTKIAEIELKASDAAVKLESLTSNSTLQAACAAVTQKDECKAMDTLQKFVNLANNQTKLADITKGNTTKEAEIQAQAAKAQTKLTAMQGNETFLAACQAINATEKGTTSSSATTSSASTSATKLSAANVLKNAGAGTAAVSTMLVVLMGMLAL